MKKSALIFLIMLLFSSTIFAQDEDETDNDSHRASAWIVIDLTAEDDDDESATVYASFLELEDGSLLEVWSGEDVLYSPNDDGTYSGATLYPAEYEFEATLTIIDEDTIETMSVIDTGTFTIETNLSYERTDFDIGIYTEFERDLQEYSLFGECMGRIDNSPPLAFAQPDPILVILIDEDAGEMIIGEHMLVGDGTTFELEEEGMFGQFEQITTQIAIVSEDAIDFTYYSIADNRDDCELRYETQYVPFDGDFANFFTQLESLIEAEEE